MQVILTVTEGPHQGREFTFDGHDTFIVGRAKCAHFRLPEKDKFFSRVHFMVEVNPPHCRLMDLGSRNGTVVNGKKALAADLKDGDLIRGGKTVIRVTIRDQPPEMATPAQAAQNLSDLPTIDPVPMPALPSTVSFRPSDSPGPQGAGSDLQQPSESMSAACVVCGVRCRPRNRQPLESHAVVRLAIWRFVRCARKRSAASRRRSPDTR